jgi:NAD(P)H dehydrogenase (quinone)
MSNKVAPGEEVATAAAAPAAAKIAIVYYSMYGHVKQLALQIKDGAEAAGCQVTLLQVAETLPAEVLAKMHAPPKDDTSIATAEALTQFDGIIFGFPTRFGNACAQMKAFMDSTGGLWFGGGLVGKTCGTFFSVGTQGGGQESTALTFLPQCIHHGMIYVPMGYISKTMMDMTEIHGGSAYGPGTYAGPDGSRQPTTLELDNAKLYGGHFAATTGALKKGRA